MVWIPDGSSGFVINSYIVTHIDDSECDNIFNCMWQEGRGVSTGRHYWKIHFRTLDGGGGVGLTSKDYFKPGYGCEGVCYNGNLSDGHRLLVSDFGPSPMKGDSIGILASFEGNRLKVYFDINGKSLGLAFDVKSFAYVFPMVRFKHSGSATCQKEIEIPNVEKRLRTIYSGIEGNWKLKNINGSSMGLSSMLTRVVFWPKVNLTKTGEDEYCLYMEVMNSFRATLSKNGSEWKTDGMVQTLIGSNEFVMQLEKQMSDLMNCVRIVNLEEDGSLSIKSGTLSTVWKRYDATPGPYVSKSRCKMM